MEMKIGARLAELRRKKGLTQEQLAEKLGISAPAVSKWETDNSYPDITLLCPLARALDTNVNTLLQFDEGLTESDIIEKTNTIIKTARDKGAEAVEKEILDLLHKYPDSVPLKFYSAIAWDTFFLVFPTIEEETKKRWRELKKELLTEVRLSGTGAYWQTATLQLATASIQENDLEKAEQLLKELPEHAVDPTVTWSLFYLKKEQPEEALKTTQKRLYSLVRHVLECLSIMLNPQIVPDMEQELKICRVYKTVDTLFGCSGMYDGLFLMIYLQMNRPEDAEACLERYIDALTGPALLPKPFLFSPGLPIKEEARPASSAELRKMLLKGLEDEQYREFLQRPRCQKALERLKASL